MRVLKLCFRVLEVCAILVGIFGIFIWLMELKNQQIDRINQSWEIVALNMNGNSGKIGALEYLNSKTESKWDYPKKVAISLYGINISTGEPPGAYLRGIDLSHANLEQASMNYADLRFSNFSNSDLRGAKLSRVDFTESNLEMINLQGACLRESKFSNTNLKNANFTDADLTGSVFESIDSLIGVDFSNANLSEVRFGSNLDKYYEQAIFESEAGKAWYIDGQAPIRIALELLDPYLKKPAGLHLPCDSPYPINFKYDN